MKRPCDDMRERIVDFTLGILSAEEARDVQAHVDACESCGRYMQALEGQGESLIALGREIHTDMDARQEKVIEALHTDGSARPRVLPFIGGFIRTAVAAVLVLAVGIAIGRLSSPKPVDVDQLRSELRANVEQLGSDLQSSLRSLVGESVRAERDQLGAELQSSIVASLEPSLRESLLADVDERLEVALVVRDERMTADIIEQVRQDVHLVATELAAGSERRVDQRFGEVVQLIEAARQTDRRQIARALEQIKTQTGMGLLRLAASTEERPMIPRKQ